MLLEDETHLAVYHLHVAAETNFYVVTEDFGHIDVTSDPSRVTQIPDATWIFIFYTHCCFLIVLEVFRLDCLVQINYCFYVVVIVVVQPYHRQKFKHLRSYFEKVILV